ncbi:hypothetical protein BIV57_19835 [Mangrovactinospora gilvigrisea]|uniref:DUF742 domain-containing protein n=1 Tax=Mangrovactinospora gilvigrisea TaxID=1428644 RepID=A0A1J7C7W3_9ACTN|nr:DUF742 domain-containing protein [Mangrovactinospora gilvigrisea]OIV35730.1 hypothetical protein BIV57_19835 [Mangrovactinospora gilvigrisea]
MSDAFHLWYDDEAGPVVRPYAMTGGRTQAAGPDFDLIALVVADSAPEDDPTLPHGHAAVLEVLQEEPLSVAEIAAELDLPVGVVRVLLGDLLDAAHIRVSRPVPPSRLPDERVLREVIDGLRAL